MNIHHLYNILLFLIGVTVSNSYSTYDGTPAEAYSAPYIVSIIWQSDLNASWHHYCAGVILNENWILTTAKCVTNFGVVTVVAGEYNLTLDEGVEQRRNILGDPIIHELYWSIGSGPYDISLWQLTKPLEFNKYIQPIALPKSEANVTGELTLYGWSSIDNETNPDSLHTTTRSLVTLDECRQLLDDRVHETNFCMGPTDKNNGACVVDMGGPIVQINGEGNTELIGLSSWRVIICWPGPYVNVQISAFIDWITEKIT